VLLVLGLPFPEGVKALSIDYLLDFFEALPQGEEKAHSHIRIGAFAPMHKFLAKIVVHAMLEVRDETNTSLSFGCLITQICFQLVTYIYDSEPRLRTPNPLGK
jgi:hypothetical protein